ncbi:MAG: hypothetical protein KDD35_06100 [Bdellovibrionales bacterium]|nr:hypothetical protein [Bdellovibrionales bacterium]
MNSRKPWAQALQVSEHNYAEWTLEAPKGITFTYWCLATKKIDEKKYLPWARNYYGLASLSEEYFSRMPDIHLWEKISSVANWDESFLPVCEWDGVVFISCVEPNPDIAWSFPVQYLLAPVLGIKKSWDRLHKATQSTIYQVPPIEDSQPEAEDVIVSEEVHIVEEEIQPENKEMLLENSPPPVPEDKEDASHQMEGLHLDQLEGLESAKKSAPKLEGIKLNFDLTKTGMSGDGPQGLPPLAVDETKSEASMAGEDGFPIGFETTKDEAVFTNQDEIPTGIFETQSSKTKDQATEANPSSPKSEKKLEPTVEARSEIKSQAHPPLPEPPAKLEDCKTEDQVVALAFSQIDLKYDGSMVLLFEGTKLRAWKWGSYWKAASEKAFLPFDISQACIFRIVRRTRMPYHGYIVENEINSEFFQNWGFNELPAHVTISPLKYDTHLVGMVLSVGKKEADTSQNLLHHEKATFLLATGLQKVTGQAA